MNSPYWLLTRLLMMNVAQQLRNSCATIAQQLRNSWQWESQLSSSITDHQRCRNVAVRFTGTTTANREATECAQHQTGVQNHTSQSRSRKDGRAPPNPSLDWCSSEKNSNDVGIQMNQSFYGVPIGSHIGGESHSSPERMRNVWW